jgi:hypothetical protein
LSLQPRPSLTIRKRGHAIRRHSPRKTRVLAIFVLAENIEDIQAQAHFARYLAVTLCGLLETTVKSLVIEYSKRKADPRTASYCASVIFGFRNPNCEKLTSLVGRLDADWREKVETFLDGSTGAAVDSVKAIRDSIAHGINHGVTLGTVTKYRDEIVKTMEFLEKLFDSG